MKDEKCKNLIILFLGLIFVYSCLRSCFLSITHDEAITVLYHSQHSFWDIVYYNTPILSNNHLLNTLLVKLSIALFGFNELAVRVPALLGHLLYLTGIYQLIKFVYRKSDVFFGIPIIFLVANPFVLDFFSLARGYSLALGFSAWGIFYFFKWKDNAEPRMKLKCIFLSSIYLFLSVLSNLSFLNIYLAVLLLAVILKLRDLSKVDYTFKGFLAEISANLFLPITPSVILLLTTLIIPIKKLIQANELYFGGTHGFWQDTVRSLVSASLYGNNYGLDNLNLIIEIIIIIFLIGGVAVMCIPFIQKKKIGDNNFILWFSLMMIAYLSIEVQHALLGTKYVIERAAIYFIYIYYIFIALFFEKLKELIKNIFIVKIINYLFFTIVVVVFIHSVKTVNFFQTYEWKYDSNTNKVMQEIDVLVNQRKDEVTIGADWEFEPSLNFYKIKYNLDNILPVNRQGPDGIFNYYYLARDNFYIINKYNLKVLKYFSDSQTALAIKTHVNH